MQIRQAKSTLLIFTYIFTMFLLPTISFHVLSLFFTNILDVQVYANLISYIILVGFCFTFWTRTDGTV